jgi:hypothetical protein
MWSPNSIPNSPEADVRIDGGNALQSWVLLSGEYAVGQLRVDVGDELRLSTQSFAEPTSLTVHSKLTNDGRVEIGYYSSLLIDGDVVFEGSGTVALAGFRSVLTGTSGSTLTNGEGHTIGKGGGGGDNNLGADQLTIINHGLIEASGSYFLTIDPANGSNGFVNGATGVIGVSGVGG